MRTSASRDGSASAWPYHSPLESSADSLAAILAGAVPHLSATTIRIVRALAATRGGIGKADSFARLGGAPQPASTATSPRSGRSPLPRSPRRLASLTGVGDRCRAIGCGTQPACTPRWEGSRTALPHGEASDGEKVGRGAGPRPPLGPRTDISCVGDAKKCRAWPSPQGCRSRPSGGPGPPPRAGRTRPSAALAPAPTPSRARPRPSSRGP